MTNLQHFKNIASLNFVLFSFFCVCLVTKISFSINIDQLSPSDEQLEHCSGNGDGETKIICQGNAAFKCSNECTNNSLTASIVQMTVWYGSIFCSF
jgi:hypothetical protein